MHTVLSPHHDDAAFSLALTLGKAAARGETIQVVNCFTQSDHAPGAQEADVEEVSRIRAHEDTEFLRSLGSGATARALGLSDTSAREGYPTLRDACHRNVYNQSEQRMVTRLADVFSRLPHDGPIFVPLAYGSHVDHRIVRTAAESVFPLEALVYYEDMPYSVSAPRRVLRKALGVSEFEAYVCEGSAVERTAKECAIDCYASQLKGATRDAILARMATLGGERVWLKTQHFTRFWT